MNRKLLLTSLLSLSLLLSGCGKSSTKSANTSADSKSDSNIAIGVTDNTAASNEELDLSEENSSKEKVKVNKEKLKNLMDNSDYISRIKIQVDSNNNISTNFIEDYKGDLSNVDITLPKSLTPGKEYIIFYSDSDDGKIKAVDSTDSYIEITGSDDGNLNYIEAHYLANPETVTKNKTSKNSKSDSSSDKKTESKTSSSSKSSSKSSDSEKSSKSSSSESEKTSKSSKESSSKNTEKSSKSSKSSDKDDSSKN